MINMGKKCKNCGKLEESHYYGTGNTRGGKWCYPLHKVRPENEKYTSRFKEDSPKP